MLPRSFRIRSFSSPGQMLTLKNNPPSLHSPCGKKGRGDSPVTGLSLRHPLRWIRKQGGVSIMRVRETRLHDSRRVKTSGGESKHTNETPKRRSRKGIKGGLIGCRLGAPGGHPGQDSAASSERWNLVETSVQKFLPFFKSWCSSSSFLVRSVLTFVRILSRKDSPQTLSIFNQGWRGGGRVDLLVIAPRPVLHPAAPETQNSR